jgi:glyoxylase-like metal-dependent hydrolase (beta-lactamase superfamily II)
MATAGNLDAILLLSHLHLDHVIRLTAFEPLFQPQGRVEFRTPEIVAGSTP